MKRTGKQIISRLLALALLISAVLPAAQPTQALEYTGTESYMAGKYYEALKRVRLTGDPRTDIVNIALSQVGYQESTYMDELSGEIIGNVNFTEYGNWYDMQDQWCAIFVSWCAALAGISEQVVPKHSYTPNGLYWLKDQWGRAYSRARVAAGAYTPQPGDLIYFKTASTKNTTNHVGIVTGYRDGIVYTVEGNTASPAIFSSGGIVARKSYAITNTYIVYICSPDYETTGLRVGDATTDRTAAEKLEQLRQAVCVLQSGADGRYDGLGRTADGAVTLGCAQWYGADAEQLLRQIKATDAQAFERLDTAGIGAALEADWLQFRPDAAQESCLRSILSSEAGVKAQNAALEQMLCSGQATAEALGVADEDGRMACGALYCLGGTAAVRRVLQRCQGDYSASGICDAMDALGYAGADLIRQALN
ncbi:MAG: CHAP domain-containing protein [Oscillospiraceae bacterium]|nr:CHAP domain-containing protein [Oscillospiraceae bacterium]